VATADKIAFIDLLARSGLRRIEATSFVSPKRIPQLADGDAVVAEVIRHPNVECTVLVPNALGARRALAAGARRWAIFASASEAFSHRNINCSISESLDRFAPVAELAQENGIPLRAYVSCIGGCPYEGFVEPAQVASVAAKLVALGVGEISLGDTIGVATTDIICAVVDAVSAEVPLERIALHCHDTFGQALANILAALELGIRTFDCSAGGLGGCPYAPGSSGNVATEDVLYLMKGLGLETGVDLYRVVEASWYMASVLGSPPASKVARALGPEVRDKQSRLRALKRRASSTT
jgi:hydroxymethylglutaryl-CoA lyase